jgi:hypothetical protein
MPEENTMAAKKTPTKTPDMRKASIIDVTLELPENVVEPRQFRIVLNRKAIETSRKATDELRRSRRLPLDPDNVSLADPLALVVLAQNNNITGEEAVSIASSAYLNQLEEVRREAMIIGMTMLTETSRKPTPYASENITELDEDTPSWLADEVKLPPVNKDLNNRYEARLKVIYDILEEAGPFFTARFESILNNDLADKLREMGVGKDVDEMGFQPS